MEWVLVLVVYLPGPVVDLAIESVGTQHHFEKRTEFDERFQLYRIFVVMLQKKRICSNVSKGKR